MSYISSLDAALIAPAAHGAAPAPELNGLLGLDRLTASLPADGLQIGLFIATLSSVSLLLTLVISSAF